MNKAERVLLCKEALDTAPRGGPEQKLNRQKVVATKGHELTIIEGPNTVTNKAGDVVGLEVWVELTIDGVVQDIDPHRVIINPPTSLVVAEAERDVNGAVTKKRELTSDPEAALWDVLWTSVEEHPSPGSKAVTRKIEKKR